MLRYTSIPENPVEVPFEELLYMQIKQFDLAATLFLAVVLPGMIVGMTLASGGFSMDVSGAVGFGY
jgi:hypothetical protein